MKPAAAAAPAPARVLPAWLRVEYLLEAAGLGLFMVSACLSVALIEHPSSPLPGLIPDPFLRRALIGIAMGLTAISLIYSPWGRRSGAHYNPAVTLTFLRLGKVAPRDAAAYIVSHFVGGALGVGLVTLVLGSIVAHPSVGYVATRPGGSHLVAFFAEAGISALLMTVVLHVSNRPRLAPYTGLCAGACVALFITFEAPFSGMSMNPARTLASALYAGEWTALWVYFSAPPLGMLTAAAAYLALRARPPVGCAKLHHTPKEPCLFCDYHQRLRRVLGVAD